MPQTPADRFERKTDRNGPVPGHRPDLGPCWLWTGSLSGGDNRGNGYGRFLIDGRFVAVHRWAYEQYVGPIPEGLELDHLCRVRRCVNPSHLEPVTRRENQMRGDTISSRNAVKTHCVHGHEFTPENTYTRVRRGRTERMCRACSIETALEWQRRKRRAAT